MSAASGKPADRRRSFSRAIGKNEGDRKSEFFKSRIRLFKFFFCLCRKTDDNVSSEGVVGNYFFEEFDLFKIFFHSIDAVHLFKDAVRAGLQGKMDEFADRRKVADRIHEV